MTKINIDDYYKFYVKWKNGFKHTFVCRGVDVKFEIKLLESYTMVDKYTWKKSTAEEYRKSLWGK